MPFPLLEEHRMTQQTARDVAQKEIAPHASEWSHSGTFPKSAIQKLAKLGLMGVCVPEEYGGSGLDHFSYILALEEIAVACASTAVIMSVNNSLVCEPLKLFGSETQKKTFLTPLAQGKKLGCFCLSEPNAGSDAGNQQTVAVKKGDRYLLSGTKNFITNGPQADFAIVFAVTDKTQKKKSVSAFIVDKHQKGVEVGKVEKKMGIQASGCCQLIFNETEVPIQNLLGSEGEGYKIALRTLDGGRIGIGAQAVGIARAAFEAASSYAKERHQFGKPIAEFQAIQWILADMATQIEAARLLVHQAAYLNDQGRPFTKEAAMAKLFASETAMKVTTDAVQVYGGYGYSKEYPVERFFRDAKITEIYEGTSEIQRLVIAAQVLK
ncbi:MAG: acyl-CoA dehydrogenase [Deltaproteobacteria bacterium]|nr:acyl-CoA dehydrogenase [Deltaproteobacteria bacterium]